MGFDDFGRRLSPWMGRHVKNVYVPPQSIEMMNDFLVIGYGNPLRGDDGVGWRVVEALEESLSASSLIAVHQLTPELAGTISEVGQVVFVDATAGNSPGEVELFPIGPVTARAGSHETTPGALLAMAAELFGRCPPAFMLTISGASFELSETLSPPVAEAVPVAVSRVLVEFAKRPIL